MTAPFLHVADLSAVPEHLHGGAVAIGNFDGVHVGHQALLKVARDWGEAHGRPSLLLTFEPHPRAFFRPGEPLFRLTPPALKARRVALSGVAGMVSCRFDAALAGLTAESFCRCVLADGLGARHVVTGADFRFGKERNGDAAALARFGALLGFTAAIADHVAVGGVAASSSRIRELLAAGDVAAANALLGWEWAIAAEVMHGDKRGRDLGYPTANLHLDPSVSLAHGIYAVRATIEGVTRAAVASFGRRPTFDGGTPKLEVHVFDFRGDLYGKTMEVAFVSYLRPELKFDGIGPLIAQMDQDSARARAVLGAG
jgi:riboflavin kinase/FMN adenylyltransferase